MTRAHKEICIWFILQSCDMVGCIDQYLFYIFLTSHVWTLSKWRILVTCYNQSWKVYKVQQNNLISTKVFLGGSHGVWFPISIPNISKYSLNIKSKFPCLPVFLFSKFAKTSTIFPNSVAKIGQFPSSVVIRTPF